MNTSGSLKDNLQKINPEISVIIPFHGELKELSHCLSGLHTQNVNFPFEVLIIESGNEPAVEKLINLPSNVKLIFTSSLLYPGKARNVGAANANSDFLAFIDADCVPSPNWLSEVYSSLKNVDKIVIGPIFNLYPFHPVASVDNLLQFIDFQKHHQNKNINHFPGCNFGITKNLFNQTEGFPEQFINGEDVMFSQVAIKENNGKIFYNPKMIVKHSGRKNLSQFLIHNKNFGFYRGYLNLNISGKQNKFRTGYLYSFLFGIKRLVYISLKTIQWNPVGILRIIFYSPVLILGLSAWVNGFCKGNRKLFMERN